MTELSAPHSLRFRIANWLPLLFILAIIGAISYVYVWHHLLFLLQVGRKNNGHLDEAYVRGIIEACVSGVFTAFLAVCYALCVIVHPGRVPDTAAWSVTGENVEVERQAETGKLSQPLVMEAKGSNGERRICKWCRKYKPDRCHHCRVCGTCVLRMDHHCPWIVNCVGYRNHKYFFLLAFYSSLDTWFIVFTIMESVERVMTVEVRQSERFAVVFGMTICLIMGSLITTFFIFHTWLMLKASTTIEFCEKSCSFMHGGSIYSCDLYHNLTEVLGDRPLLWLLPVSLPSGDGVEYKVNSLAPRRGADSGAPAMPEVALPEASRLDSEARQQAPEWTGELVDTSCEGRQTTAPNEDALKALPLH